MANPYYHIMKSLSAFLEFQRSAHEALLIAGDIFIWLSLATAIEGDKLAIHCKQALRTFDAPERITPDRN